MALAYFRDKFIFQTHEDELDNAELKEELLARADARRSGRSLYGARVAKSRAVMITTPKTSSV